MATREEIIQAYLQRRPQEEGLAQRAWDALFPAQEMPMPMLMPGSINMAQRLAGLKESPFWQQLSSKDKIALLQGINEPQISPEVMAEFKRAAAFSKAIDLMKNIADKKTNLTGSAAAPLSEEIVKKFR